MTEKDKEINELRRTVKEQKEQIADLENLLHRLLQSGATDCTEIYREICSPK